MMGGKINVQSEFGKGSIFMIELPQKISKMSKPTSEEDVLLAAAKMSSNNTNIDNYKNKRVLIVDDNKLNIKVARRALDDFDLIVDEVYDGVECLDKIKSGANYDLILMDIMMPNMTGETTLQELKKLGLFNTPVIAITADAVAGAREKYLNEGFIDYIPKPFTKEEIKEKLDLVFNKKSNIQEGRFKDAPTLIFQNGEMIRKNF